MENNIDKVPGLFEGTAALYSRFRHPYPSTAIQLLVDRFSLNSATTVLDLGCGTGQIAIPLAQRKVQVVALDPDAEMLAEGLRQQAALGVRGIAWALGTDTTVESMHLPALRVCCMGASFHWTNRERLLLALNTVIDPVGGVFLISNSTSSVWREECDDWSIVAKNVIQEILGGKRRAAGGTYEHPTDRHEVVVRRSPFSRVTTYEMSSTIELTIEEIIGLQMSTSYASSAQLGSKVQLFQESLGNRLLELNPSGLFSGTLRTKVIVATR